MTLRYLLPCPCGRKVPIEPRQAGQTIQCACGASLEVPTMLGMTSLELAEPEPAVEDRPVAWGVRQSLVLLGAAIILGALVLGIYFLSTRPAMPLQRTSPEQIRRNSQSLTALQSWRIWLAMRANGLDRRQPPEDKAYEEQYVRWWLKMGVVLLIAVVGAGLVVVPLATRKTRPADPLPQDAESGPP